MHMGEGKLQRYKKDLLSKRVMAPIFGDRTGTTRLTQIGLHAVA